MANPIQDRDEGLIEGYVGGEASAMTVVDGWIEVVLRHEFRSIARDWEDVRQEVRTRLFRNLSRGDFRRDSDLRTYVHQVTKHVCVDQVRGRRLESRRLAEVPEPRTPPEHSTAHRHMLRDLVERLLRGLSAVDRRLLYLVHVERFSYAEAARDLGISEGAVKLRMFRCRRRILKRRRRLLRHRYHEDGAP